MNDFAARDFDFRFVVVAHDACAVAPAANGTLRTGSTCKLRFLFGYLYKMHLQM